MTSRPPPVWTLSRGRARGRCAPQASLWGWALLGVLGAASVGADAATDDKPLVRNVPQLALKTVDLPSGMRILLELDPSRPLVGVAAVVDCGSSQDPPGHEGLAHLVEHLTFRAKHGGSIALSNLLDLAGAGVWNAFTQHDLTTYFEVGPRESLAELVRLEGARLADPLAGVDTDVFETEREVVRNELLQGDENGQRTAAWETLGADLYPAGHPYRRPTIGTGPSLWSLKPEDAQAFVQECYQPRNYTVVISGDFDPGSMGKVLEESFPAAFLAPQAAGTFASKSRLDQAVADPSDPPSKEDVHWVKAPADHPSLYIGWTLPRAIDADAYVQTFLASAVRSVARENLGKEILSVETVLDRGKFGSTLYLVAMLRTGADPNGSTSSLLRSVGKLWHLSALWFKESVDYAFVNLVLHMDTFEARLVERAQLTHLTGDPNTYRRQLEGLGKIERRQVETLSYKWLGSGRARVVFLKPDDWEPPEREVGGSARVFAPSDNVRMKLSPSALATYVHPPKADLRSVMLENGLEVVLVHRAGGMASVTVALRSGSATATPRGVADLANILLRSKSTKSPATWGIGIRTTTDLDTTFLHVSAANGNVEAALAIAAERLTSVRGADSLPTIWTTDFFTIRKEEEQKSSSRMRRALFENVYSDSVYPRRPTVADYERLTPEDAQGWIERAYRPENAVAVLVCDLELSEAEKLVRNAFGAWKGSSAPPDAPFVAPVSSVGPIRTFRIDRPASKQTEILIGCAARPKDARDAIALRLLSAQLKTRLSTFARERYGGSYGIHDTPRLSRRFSGITVWGLVDDRNLTRVLALARKELEELPVSRISSEDLDNLKWHAGIASTVANGGASELGYALASARAAGLPLDFVTDFPKHLEAVTSDDVARMAAVCRASATLGLLGDPAVIEKAFASTGLLSDRAATP